MRRAFEMLGILDDEDVQWLITHGELRRVAADDYLIRLGRSIQEVFIVISGSFSVRIGAQVDQSIAVLRSGDMVGEISFVDSRPPSASVVAIQPGDVLALSSKKLRTKLDTDSQFAARYYRAIATLLSSRLRNTVGRLGYGRTEEEDPDLLDDSDLEYASLGARRFDVMLQLLQGD